MITTEELTKVLESLNIGTSYLENVEFRKNERTFDHFSHCRDLCGAKWGTHKYYDGIQRRDSWSDWGAYWVEDHPQIQYIETTHAGWKESDGTRGQRKSVSVYYKGE
jgi:hypothetical protein